MMNGSHPKELCKEASKQGHMISDAAKQQEANNNRNSHNIRVV